MLLRQDEDSLYRALLQRDRAYEGFAYVGVRTTRIFCRLSCSARKPRRENVLFFRSTQAAQEAGFRACKRCRPTEPGAMNSRALLKLRSAVDRDPGRRWTSADLIRAGFDPKTARRAFKREYGVTFIQFARATRLGLAVAGLRRGHRAIDAQFEAGYESGSGFRDAMAATLQIRPRDVSGQRALTAGWIDTVLGAMLAVVDDRGVHLLEFADRRALATEMRLLRRREGPVAFGRHATLEQLRAELAQYFTGSRTRFSIPLAQRGSEFERQVWRELAGIPMGETRSYGQIARSLDRPSAARAVARANGKNQLALLIPCHRVVGADGALTGYGGKLWRKQWLLEHEARLGKTSAHGRATTA